MNSSNAPLIKVSDPNCKVISPNSLFDLRMVATEGLDVMLDQHCLMTLYVGKDPLTAKCFELSGAIDWTIGRTFDNKLVLIPTRKEE